MLKKPTSEFVKKGGNHVDYEDDSVEDVCEFCGGEGWEHFDEDDGEGHIMRGVGVKRCICQKQFNEDDYDE